MNDEQVAFEGWRKFASQFPGLVKGFEMLGSIGSLKQAGDEAQSRLDALKEEHAKLVTQVESDRAAAATQLKELTAEMESTKAAAENHIANRTAEAESIVASAKARAQGLVADAQSEAARIVDDANHATAAIKNRIGELSNTVNDRTSELEKVEAQIAGRQAVLDGINTSISDLKARL